jgi:hypothetical protein
MLRAVLRDQTQAAAPGQASAAHRFNVLAMMPEFIIKVIRWSRNPLLSCFRGYYCSAEEAPRRDLGFLCAEAEI